MRNKVNRPLGATISFAELQTLYGLKKPAQIKLRIIWQHVQALTLRVHGSTRENVQKMKGYDRQFRVAEREENEAVG